MCSSFKKTQFFFSTLIVTSSVNKSGKEKYRCFLILIPPKCSAQNFVASSILKFVRVKRGSSIINGQNDAILDLFLIKQI